MTPEELAAIDRLGTVVLILVLIAVIAGIWMTIDAWINYGPGWSVGAGAGCLLGTLGCGVGGCLVLIPYIIIRFAAYPPAKMREYRAARAAGVAYPPSATPTPLDISLEPDEPDRLLEELINESRLPEALARAQELLSIAKDFHDARGIQRYSKYVERIRRGMR